MAQDFRGGNSRLLARSLEQISQPMAVLDHRGTLVYVNAALCSWVQVEASELVGKECSWQISEDRSPAAALLNALAPPASCRSGKIAARQFTTPLIFGSDLDAELFVPMVGDSGQVELTLVILGKWQDLQNQMPAATLRPEDRRDAEATLTQLRSRWSRLDGLHALLGSSPAAELSMIRAQLAASSECNTLLFGPAQVGKATVAYGIYCSRLKRRGIQAIAGLHFPIDAGVAQGAELMQMLELFRARIKPDMHLASQNLLFRSIDQFNDDSVAILNDWLSEFGKTCTLMATSESGLQELATKGPQWKRLALRIAQVEVPVQSLAQRREDIPVLVHQAVAEIASAEKRLPPTITADCMELLVTYNWPGNLFELSQTVNTALLMARTSEAVQATHLPLSIRAFPGTASQSDGQASPIELDAVMMDFEREVIRRAIAASPRNRAGAARLLGISRPRLLRRIEQLGLDVTTAR